MGINLLLHDYSMCVCVLTSRGSSQSLAHNHARYYIKICSYNENAPNSVTPQYTLRDN